MQMDFDNRMNIIYNYFDRHFAASLPSALSNWFNLMKADVVNNINNFQVGHFLQTFTELRDGVIYEQDTANMSRFSRWNRLYDYQFPWGSSTRECQLTEGAFHPASTVYLCLTTVRKIADLHLPANNVYNPMTARYTDKEEFLSQFGDYLVFDFIHRPESADNLSMTGLYIDDGTQNTEGFMALKFGDTYIPLANWWKPNSLTSDEWYYLTGDSRASANPGSSVSRGLDLYNCYYCIENNVNNWGTQDYNALQTIAGHYSKIFDPTIVDLIVKELQGIGVNIVYTDPDLNPETADGPRINDLVIHNGTIFPAFDKEFNGPYTVTTDNETVVFEWTNNSLVDKNYVNLEQVIGNLYTFRSLEVGYTQANLTVENDTSGDYFDYEIQIKKTGEYYNDPWISKIWIKDAQSGVIYKPFPEETKNIKFYLVDIGLNSSQLKGKFYLDTASTYDLANITVEIKINDTLGWQNYNPGAEVNIPITESPQSIFLKLTSAITQNEINYEICFQRSETNSVNTNPGQGDVIPGSNGITSGTSAVADLTADYPPGFYGGSYIPTWRYTKPIFTTANGGYDFELNYPSRQSANENAVATLNSIINSYTVLGKLDAICEAFIHYSNFINDDSGNVNWRYVLPAINVSILRPLTLTKDNITPKNKKCYIYPFCELELNGYGTNSEMPYEEFKHEQSDFESGKHILQFDILCKWFAGTSIQVVPVNFQQIEDNFDYAVAGPEMPVFPYTKDQYLNEYNASRNTRAQALEAARQNATLNNVKGVIDGFNQIAGGVVSMNMKAPAGGALQVIGGAANMLTNLVSNEMQMNQLKASLAAELKDTANRPSTVSNQNASPSITMVMKDAACPFIIHKSIRPEFMRKVDRFFTRFGYRTNRTGIPNIYKRPNFAYLECKNAVIGGNIPAEDKMKLKAIMEHGITFWHYGSSNFAGVGEYKDADLTYNAPTYS